jgi:hypothetical protein
MASFIQMAQMPTSDISSVLLSRKGDLTGLRLTQVDLRVVVQKEIWCRYISRPPAPVGQLALPVLPLFPQERSGLCWSIVTGVRLNFKFLPLSKKEG